MRAQPFHWVSVVLSVLALVFLVLKLAGRTGPLDGMFWTLVGGSMVVGGIGTKLDRRLKQMPGPLPNVIIWAGVLLLVLSIVLFAMR